MPNAPDAPDVPDAPAPTPPGAGAASPFHAGERAAQARFGLADKLEATGRRVVRPSMPDQHRALFEQLPYLLIGAVDDHGQPWAAMLTGAAGFVRTPDAQTLQIRARLHAEDPLAPSLTAGRPVGLLGIELATRRRNRANGTLLAVEPQLVVRVSQSFGNCPQYIQARSPSAPVAAAGHAPAIAEGARLSAAAIAVLGQADTLFLASSTPGAPRDVSDGVDVSHRGGRPGFVAVEQRGAQTVLLIPDYRGNFLFNTLGNLELHPRAGLLAIDFATGALLSLTAHAKVCWDDPRVASFAGAQRLLELRVTRGVLRPQALPWRWSAPHVAPQLDEP